METTPSYKGFNKQPDIRAAFVVRPFEGTYRKTIVKKTETGLQQEVVEREGGYMVEFPKYGNSLHVTSREELDRLGFGEVVPVLNDEGDVVRVDHVPLPKKDK